MIFFFSHSIHLANLISHLYYNELLEIANMRKRLPPRKEAVALKNMQNSFLLANR